MSAAPSVPATGPLIALPAADWQARAHAHETRVRAWTDPHQARAGRGEKHPVYDFLFTYYGFRPAWLRRWHPGPGFNLSGPAADFSPRPRIPRDCRRRDAPPRCPP